MYTPGEYISLQRVGKVPWPALVCVDDMAPPRVLYKRPTGYWTLVLLIKRKPEFVYALGSDMIDFDPFGSAQKNDDPELEHAYEMVLDEMDSPGSSLDHWRQLTEDSDSEYLPTPPPTASPTIEDDPDDDESMKIAKQLSLAELQTDSMKRAAVTTFAQLPMKRPISMPDPHDHFSDKRHEGDVKRKKKRKTGSSRSDSSRQQLDRDDCVDGSLFVEPSTKQPKKKACPMPDPRYHVSDKRAENNGKGKEKASLSRPDPSQRQLNDDDYIDGNLCAKPSTKQPKNEACPLPGPRYDFLDHRTENNGKGKEKASSNRPDPIQHQLNDDDYIDGKLSESRDMVKVYVGEGDQEQEFLIPRHELDKCPSLSDPKIGCIIIASDGTPQLSSPCLRSFPPDDFRFVAEFLSTGTFGRSVLEDDDGQSNNLMFAECVAAWKIADRLVIEDLLDLIAAKIQQTLPWDMDDAWTLAKIVYETEGSPLKAYAVMKGLVAGVVADNFLDLAVVQGEYFIEPLRELPELQRDVYKRLMERAEAKLAE